MPTLSPRTGPRPGRRALDEGLAVVRALADLVLPASCAGCGMEGPEASPLCGQCLPALARPARVAWPSPSPSGLPEPWAAADYAGAVRGALTAHKEHGRRALAPPLAAALARALAAALEAGDAAPVRGAPATLVVPVPSTRAARRRRGGDPLFQLLGRALPLLEGAPDRRARGYGPQVAPVLVQARRPADQAGLGAAARWENLAGALAVVPSVRPLLAGRVVLLVDDVLTTGATLAEAARALRDAGAVVERAAVVAATPRRPRRPSPHRDCPVSSALRR